MNEPLRIAVLVSGSGRTLQNLQHQITAGLLGARIVIAISDRANAPGLTYCRKVGIRTECVPADHRLSERIFAHCREENVQLVCMAGFLRLLNIPADYSGQVLNIHPSLLPAFGGRGMYGHFVHQAVLSSKVTESGCTVHIVDDLYDHGPVVLQKRVPVMAGDTAESLAERVFAAECEAYPAAIQMWIMQFMK